jgi:penicillin amidase
MTTETIRLPGLGAPGRITVDRWGIPHIEAQTRDDLFFLQGFNAARDRLWQIDLWRKRGLGRLAGDFGPGYLEQDAAARMFLYRGDMAAEWASYGFEAKAICEAFVAGINAYVALTEREPERLPPEFDLMGTRPALWSAEDVVRIRSHGLTRNALSEVARLAVLGKADHPTDLLRRHLEPPRTPEPAVPWDAIPLEALDPFKLAQAPVSFPPARVAASRSEAARWRKVDDLGEVYADPALEGSNNWAVSGARTPSGKPIMGSDPHRAHALPSLRYIVHLSMPGVSVIGGGEPCVPGVSLGHNGIAAFSLTIFGADQEDVYLVDTDPSDETRYRFRDAWAAMTVVEERIPVRGGDDEIRRLAFTRHGPVMWRDGANHRAVAIRSAWFEPGAAPYLQSLSMMGATTLGAFTASARRWGTPSVNLVYADTTGTIAWTPAGYMPVRRGWDGLLPVPGDGRFEWDGLLDQSKLPLVVDPPSGYVHSANEMNLPADWPHAERPVGFEWTEGSRAKRIADVLAVPGLHDVAASCALQTDSLSRPARRMSRLIARLIPVDADALRGLELLWRWDHRLDAGSAPAALFEVWWTTHLKPAVMARLAPDRKVRALLAPGDVEGLLRVLERPDRRFGDNPNADRDAVLLTTLGNAVRDLDTRLGPDETRWAWGLLHHGAFDHPLDAFAKAPRWNVGPLPKGGSASTPMHAGYRASDYRVMQGASFRMVVDLGDLDASRTINAPGQSGDPRSPHYADLAPLWAKGEYVPLLYTPAAIADAAETVLELVPA